MTLANLLASLGYTGTVEDFHEVLADVFQVMCPAYYNDEELACNPSQAVVYCHAVRARTSQGIPDHVIMRALSNRRKNPAREDGQDAA